MITQFTCKTFSVILMLGILSLAPVQGQEIDRIADSLKSINARLPVEKVYLHTDKPAYNIGDTIWLKAYVTDAEHRLSNLSNLLYVELLDKDARFAERISIRIKDGLGYGQLPLRATQYLDGEYTLRAYTNWMQNFWYRYVFSQRFFIGRQAEDTWLVKSNVEVDMVNTAYQLKVSLLLNRIGESLPAVALKDVAIKIYDDKHLVINEEMRTSLEGKLSFSKSLKSWMNGKRMRMQITSLDPKDNNKTIEVPLLINRSNRIDLQFLPEGGKLVAGITSVLGFKAVGEDGRGIQVSGSISDSHGKKVADFSSLYKGMGTLEFTPGPNESYTAKIDVPNGVTETYALPKPEAAGTVLRVENIENASEIKVTLSGLDRLEANSSYALVGIARGKMRYAQLIGTGQTQVYIDKSLFPTGVARLTLFKGINPVNERLVYIDHYDNLRIKITPDKPLYGRRDSIGLSIEVKDKEGRPVQGHFSLSVTDNVQVTPDTLGDYDITTSLLLNSAVMGNDGKTVLKALENVKVKGELESPGYYVNRKSPEAWKALDNLMLTEGWTDYSWEDVLSGPKIITFQLQNTHNITGRVTDVLNRPRTNTTVYAISQKPSFIEKTLTDKNGEFVFKDLLLIDSGFFLFQASNASGKPMVLGGIEVNRTYSPIYVPFAYRSQTLPWYVNADTTEINRARRLAELERLSKLSLAGNMLKEVEIKGKKIIKGSRNPYGPGNADYIFDENDFKRSGLNNLFEFVTYNIPHVKMNAWMPFNFYTDWLDTEIDGVRLVLNPERPTVFRVEEVAKYQLSGIKGIELIYSRKYTRSNFARPLLVITTYSGKAGLMQHLRKDNAYRPLAVTRPKAFYTPKYIIPEQTVLPDYRSTIHWEPNLVTDENGKAKVSFYTSDSAGNFSINIQGLGTSGTIGRLLYRLL